MQRRWLVGLLLASALAAAGASAAAAAAARIPSSHRLKAGQHVVFKAGTIRVGAKIVCTSHGHRVGALVPKPGTAVVGVSDWSGGGATIRLTTRANGSVVARCR